MGMSRLTTGNLNCVSAGSASMLLWFSTRPMSSPGMARQWRQERLYLLWAKVTDTIEDPTLKEVGRHVRRKTDKKRQKFYQDL